MTQEITHVTVVHENLHTDDYQRGDIGQALKPLDHCWLLSCPGCGKISIIPKDRIIEHDEDTVSTKEPLHCHGSRMRQRYSIERNEVKWL